MTSARMFVWGLRHKRLRQAAIVLVIALTVSVVSVFASALNILVRFAQTSHSELIIGLARPRLDAWDVLGQPVTLYPKLQQLDGVQAVSRYLLFSGKHPSGTKYTVAGEDDDGLVLHRSRFWVDDATIEVWKKDPIGAIPSDALARALDLRVGKVVELPTEFGPMKVRIVGLSRAFGYRVAVRLAYAQELAKARDVQEYRVYTKPADFSKAAIGVSELTKNTPAPLKLVSMNQLTADIARRASLAVAVLGFLGAFLVLVTALTLANATAIGIRERRIETATFRVIGFHRRTMLLQLLAQPLFLGLLGGALGMAITRLVVGDGLKLTNNAQEALKPIQLTQVGVIAGLAIAILVPLLGALPSAYLAVRRPLVDALRETA